VKDCAPSATTRSAACPRGVSPSKYVVAALFLALGAPACAGLWGFDPLSNAPSDGGASSVDGGTPDGSGPADAPRDAPLPTDGPPSGCPGCDAGGADSGAHGVIVLFGGQDTNSTYDDTVIWNGETWTTLTLAKSPPARSFHSVAAANGTVVVFGGYDSNGNDLADTWSWDGASWTSSAATGPSARDSAPMTSAQAGAVLFGGKSVATVFADLWQWDGASWTLESITDGGTTGPSPRWAAALAPLNGAVVLFGGKVTGNGHVSDTWIWDGTSWTEVLPAQSPPACSYASMLTLNGDVILFGCAGDATWKWDGSAWTMVADAGPPSRNGAAAAVLDGKIVLFGGIAGNTYLGDTWEWDGVAWTEKTPPASPPARAYAGMAALP
jgi:Galactose oxidase, central domain